MNKKEFIRKSKEHLANYKERKLGETGCGKWWGNNREYKHILPIDKSFKNIIKSNFHNELINLLDNNSVHLGFHHLNSSQALALNLFGPLVKKNKLNLIDSNIMSKAIGKFEYIENQNENTNFDFFINNLFGTNYYFEVKYSEEDFGKATDNETHKQKYNEIYEPELKKITQIKEIEFYNEYQLWRNILYAKNGMVYFVLPSLRTDLIEKVNNAKQKIFNKANNDRINILLIEELVDRCKQIDELRDHYIEFEEKYLKFI